MQFCQNHWEMLREEIHAQGMGGWIATSGEVAIEQMANQLESGETTAVNYDPLMACHNMVMSRALEGLGLVVMSPEFGCPICFLNENLRTEDGACACGHPECPNREPHSTPDFETWIVGPSSCVMSAKSYMIEQGWLALGSSDAEN